MDHILKINIILILVYLTTSASSACGADSYVTDDSLDHDDINIEGTITKALDDCADVGGAVRIGSGIFTLNSSTLIVNKNCRLVGSGPSTVLNIKHSGDAIRISTGDSFSNGNWAIEDISIKLPANSSASSIRTVPAQGSIGKIEDVMISGGGGLSTGITLDAVNSVHIDGLYYDGFGNGVYITNSPNYPVNYGDSSIVNSHVRLRSPFTTGVYIGGDNNSRHKINNILISGLSVNAFESLENTVGIHIRNSSRITLINTDIERMDVCLRQDSKQNGGTPAQSNAFINVFTLGCNDDYLEVGIPLDTTISGGYGELLTLQQIGSKNLDMFDQVVGRVPVITAVRSIEHISDPAVNRSLIARDSGKVFTNKGATGVVTFHLPPALNAKSVEYHFYSLSTSHPLRILPTEGDLIRPGQVTTGVGYISGLEHGQYITLRNIDSTVWAVVSTSGEWYSE